MWCGAVMNEVEYMHYMIVNEICRLMCKVQIWWCLLSW